ncbi:hypothetical protein ZYGR_0P03910 [Zygosaccharomyces rouxii]|uniref:ZYRO0E09482p n=2 Tax=Zygosaccharomyces rouxii TaxID=4956 RepID=C5E4X4_ZYGRC|nr:uncharacterized protein ZYRO0E09482g [Zygosaccharomyces rouxii]KAH9198060.1 hypothetical protein LQ764DRAFT_146145 [Zygosaccharomyces rouxii]GAV49745.1 hypothetical protein ZYGR_0P03910 [Zygosaccharomyces rouxii]CAR31085.1 ZYRO0E09482p [Zygosaccharomyces rouxii]
MDKEGASFGEQLLDASRRNNIDLLKMVFEGLGGDPERISELINESRDPLGDTALHLCCRYGSWEVLDEILDQDGIEIDPQNTKELDTPLHVTVRYAHDEPEHGTFIARNLVEVGADPRIKNMNGDKPVDLIHGDDLDELIDLLQGAELAADNDRVDDGEEGEIIEDDGEDVDDED